MMHPALAHLQVDAFASREDWLASRASNDSVGASEGAMVMGVSPWGTPWDLWESKRRKGEKKGAQLTRGHRWEPAVLAEYDDESGHRVLKPEDVCGRKTGEIVILSDPKRPWLRETPDALALDERDGLGHVEAKTAMRPHVWAPEAGIVIDRWEDQYADLVPPYYAIQGYLQLEVTSLPWNDLCALVPTSGWLSVRWVRLMRDTDTQGELVDFISKWRDKHLVGGEPPPVDASGACNRYLARRFPTGKFKVTRTATAQELADMRELYRLRRIAADAELRAKKLSNKLLAQAEGHRLRVPECGPKGPFGQPQGTAGRVTVNMDALRAEAPDLVRKHERKGDPYSSFHLYHFDQLEN